jgi:sugar phosphate isomerase/epimerase
MTDPHVPRRTFLTAAVAGGAALLVGRPRHLRGATIESADDASARGSTVRLGVASYSLRNFPLARALEMIDALATPYVSFKSVHVPYETSSQGLAALRRQIEAAGVTIVGGGTITFETDSDDGVRRYFEYAKGAGMPLIVCTGAPSVMPRVERFAREYDIKVAIHNHGPEDKDFPSPYDALAVVKGMDRRMGLCIDVGHTVRTGTDVVAAIRDAGPRLLDMHIKDLRDLRVKESQCIVGQGKIPISDIFRALDSIGYGGYVNLEYEIDADDPLPGMKQSFAYMRGVLAGMNTASAPTRTGSI